MARTTPPSLAPRKAEQRRVTFECHADANLDALAVGSSGRVYPVRMDLCWSLRFLDTYVTWGSSGSSITFQGSLGTMLIAGKKVSAKNSYGKRSEAKPILTLASMRYVHSIGPASLLPSCPERLMSCHDKIRPAKPQKFRLRIAGVPAVRCQTKKPAFPHHRRPPTPPLMRARSV